MIIEDLLPIIKNRCYIVNNIFDEEIKSLISSAIIDCIESGIKEITFEKDVDSNSYDDLVINCLTAYVKAYRGNDRSDTESYMKMYESIRNKMTQLAKYNRDVVDNE